MAIKKRVRDPKHIFNPALFWDADKIKILEHKNYIIARILNFGSPEDLKMLRSIYSNDEIIKVVKVSKELLPLTANFWAIYFHLPKEEITCLYNSYQNTR